MCHYIQMPTLSQHKIKKKNEIQELTLHNTLSRGPRKNAILKTHTLNPRMTSLKRLIRKFLLINTDQWFNYVNTDWSIIKSNYLKIRWCFKTFSKFLDQYSILKESSELINPVGKCITVNCSFIFKNRTHLEIKK